MVLILSIFVFDSDVVREYVGVITSIITSTCIFVGSYMRFPRSKAGDYFTFYSLYLLFFWHPKFKIANHTRQTPLHSITDVRVRVGLFHLHLHVLHRALHSTSSEPFRIYEYVDVDRPH